MFRMRSPAAFDLKLFRAVLKEGLPHASNWHEAYEL